MTHTYHLVTMFSSNQMWSKVISVAKEIVVWHQPVQWFSNQVYVQWALTHSKPSKKIWT